MKILAKTTDSNIATVFIGEINGKKIEFVESVQPPQPINIKWVLIISTLFGCPVSCNFCDSGGYYNGKIKKEDLFAQIDYLIKYRFPDGFIDTDKFKIQFARMGEPLLNSAVLEVLEELPKRIRLKGNLLPSISTIAPAGKEHFFNKLLRIKNNLYGNNFQLQFSIHSTSEKQRDELIPVKKWSFSQIAEYGNEFFNDGNRKITLNFALAAQNEFNIKIIEKYFAPEKFIIKLTPVNPTYKAIVNDIATSNHDRILNITKELDELGFDSIYSIGELEENQIGSNCGQYITNYLKECNKIDAYSYELENVI